MLGNKFALVQPDRPSPSQNQPKSPDQITCLLHSLVMTMAVSGLIFYTRRRGPRIMFWSDKRAVLGCAKMTFRGQSAGQRSAGHIAYSALRAEWSVLILLCAVVGFGIHVLDRFQLLSFPTTGRHVISAAWA